MTFPGSVSLLIRQPPVSQEPRSVRFRKVRNFRTPLCPIRPHLQFFSLHPNANVGQQVMFFDERRLPQIYPTRPPQVGSSPKRGARRCSMRRGRLLAAVDGPAEACMQNAKVGWPCSFNAMSTSFRPSAPDSAMALARGELLPCTKPCLLASASVSPLAPVALLSRLAVLTSFV